MSTEKPRPPMVCVTWEDASQMDSTVWVENSGKHEYTPHIHCQVGFLLRSTRRGIVIVSTWSQELVSQRDSIPRGMIRSIEYLEPKRAPRARKA